MEAEPGDVLIPEVRTVTAKRLEVVFAAESGPAARPSGFRRRSGSCSSICRRWIAMSWVVRPCLSLSPQ